MAEIDDIIKKTAEVVLTPVQMQLSEILKKQNEHGIELKEVKLFLYDPDKGLVSRMRDTERTVREMEADKQSIMNCRLQTQKSNQRLSDVEAFQVGKKKFSWLLLGAIVAALASSILGVIFRG